VLAVILEDRTPEAVDYIANMFSKLMELAESGRTKNALILLFGSPEKIPEDAILRPHAGKRKNSIHLLFSRDDRRFKVILPPSGNCHVRVTGVPKKAPFEDKVRSDANVMSDLPQISPVRDDKGRIVGYSRSNEFSFKEILELLQNKTKVNELLSLAEKIAKWHVTEIHNQELHGRGDFYPDNPIAPIFTASSESSQ
jgi:hypothetical protein